MFYKRLRLAPCGATAGDAQSCSPDDWKGKFDFLKEEGVEVVYLPRTPEISTSQIKHDLYDANAVDSESKTSHDEINTDPKG